MNKIKKGDEIVVITGKDKGRRGKVSQVLATTQLPGDGDKVAKGGLDDLGFIVVFTDAQVRRYLGYVRNFHSTEAELLFQLRRDFFAVIVLQIRHDCFS